ARPRPPRGSRRATAPPPPAGSSSPAPRPAAFADEQRAGPDWATVHAATPASRTRRSPPPRPARDGRDPGNGRSSTRRTRTPAPSSVRSPVLPDEPATGRPDPPTSPHRPADARRRRPPPSGPSAPPPFECEPSNGAQRGPSGHRSKNRHRRPVNGDQVHNTGLDVSLGPGSPDR